MALYKQKDSKVWHYDFVVAGKRYRGSTKEARKTVALAVEAELRNRAREKGPNFMPQRRTQTLRELSERFLRWKDEAQLEPKTKRYYEFGWKLLAGTPLANTHLAAIEADQVDAVKFVGLRGGAVSGQYANQAIRTLKVMLNKAKEWRLIAEVPTLKLRKAAGRQMVYSAEDEAAILTHANPDLRDAFTVAMDTGMRPCEFLRMRWEDVFFREQYIFVPKSKTDAGRRKVPMSARVSSALMDRRKKAVTPWVFPNRLGTGHLQSLAKGFQVARRKAGLDKRLVLYSARHSFGTYSLAASQNLPAVMQAMGHANVNSTLPYQHQGIDGIRSVIDARNAERKQA